MQPARLKGSGVPWCQSSQDIPKSPVPMDQTFRIWRTVRQLKIFVKVFGLVGWCVDGQDSGYTLKRINIQRTNAELSYNALFCRETLRTLVIHCIFIFADDSHPFISCHISLSRSNGSKVGKVVQMNPSPAAFSSSSWEGDPG